MLTRLEKQWQTGAWTDVLRVTNTYDVNNNILTSTQEVSQGGALVNNQKMTYTYDVNGNPVTSLMEQWQGSAWGNLIRHTYAYDVNNNLISDVGDLWQSGAWITIQRLTYTFDSYGNSITGKYERFTNGNWHPYVVDLLNICMNNVWKIKTIYGYRYGAHFVTAGPAGMAYTPKNELFFRVFPNPAAEKINITYDAFNKAEKMTISICDINGRSILSHPMHQKDMQIDIAGLSKGLYLLRLEGKKGCMVKKFIKEK
ncbi:MAG TPA: T9SS type A sorting domain-containing protein [Bacteroidales bacterium]|nr:T9SS type A sorting domain-containing protein [Bacteroidales bacterium]HPI31459.1 T9SS type A sorting domain-containing protein [Bacteroidales bacterium]HQN17284.1 T9SS type A sorting domain-containing protein [Bacteroidales bacterium]HQP14557.1 T9SS type A sorting domain-containing protein [Bacteroidales bacterium]